MLKDNNAEALIAHVPVIQKGYLDLFERHPKADMHVLDNDVLKDFPYLRKDIRALEPEQSVQIIKGLDIFPTVKLLGKSAISSVGIKYDKIIMPSDDISRQLDERYFFKKAEFEPIFLRWDRENTTVNVEVLPDQLVKASDFQEDVIQLLYEEAERATSWWRRVGAAVVINGRVVLSDHNRNMPTEYSSNIDGDPRSVLKRGVGIEITNDVHAEALMIATAAREGIALEGSSIYIDTFPCPKCAKDVVNAGIKECYYINGYAVTDALSVLKAGGVEIIKIETDIKPQKGLEAIPYPK